MIDVNRVKELAQEWLADKDYFLVDVNVNQENRIVVEIDHKEGVWIDDCCELSRHIEEGLDRNVEDFELEVGSAGIGQPFKVVQQYYNAVGQEVELLTETGKKLKGIMSHADEDGFVVTVREKQTVEGRKRPQMVDVERSFAYKDVKWVRAQIEF